MTIMFFRKAMAFLKKDFSIQVSYKLSFSLIWVGILISVLTFYFIAKLLGKGANPYLLEYGGSYFPFVLIGIAFYTYLSTAMGTFSGTIRGEQVLGTLEAMLVTPTKIPTLIIGMSLWSFIFASVKVLVYLLFGAWFFGVNLANMNIFAAMIILILTIISFSSIGIISAAFVMVLKRGEPVGWIIATFSGLFGGVYFPITILPQGLRVISYILPITYSLRSLRHALLQGYSIRMLSSDIIVLLIFSLILLPLSISIFKYALRKAKIDGSLAHY